MRAPEPARGLAAEPITDRRRLVLPTFARAHHAGMMRPTSSRPTARPASRSEASPAARSAADATDSKGLLASLAAAGYTNLSVDEIIEMRNQGITGQYMKEMSEAGFGPAWVRPSWRIETQDHGEAAARSSNARSSG